MLDFFSSLWFPLSLPSCAVCKWDTVILLVLICSPSWWHSCFSAACALVHLQKVSQELHPFSTPGQLMYPGASGSLGSLPTGLRHDKVGKDPNPSLRHRRTGARCWVRPVPHVPLCVGRCLQLLLAPLGEPVLQSCRWSQLSDERWFRCGPPSNPLRENSASLCALLAAAMPAARGGTALPALLPVFWRGFGCPLWFVWLFVHSASGFIAAATAGVTHCSALSSPMP